MISFIVLVSFSSFVLDFAVFDYEDDDEKERPAMKFFTSSGAI